MEARAKKRGRWQLLTKTWLCSGPTSQRLWFGSPGCFCDQSPIVTHGLAVVHVHIQSLTCVYIHVPTIQNKANFDLCVCNLFSVFEHIAYKTC